MVSGKWPKPYRWLDCDEPIPHDVATNDPPLFSGVLQITDRETGSPSSSRLGMTLHCTAITCVHRREHNMRDLHPVFGGSPAPRRCFAPRDLATFPKGPKGHASLP